MDGVSATSVHVSAAAYAQQQRRRRLDTGSTEIAVVVNAPHPAIIDALETLGADAPEVAIIGATADQLQNAFVLPPDNPESFVATLLEHAETAGLPVLAEAAELMEPQVLSIDAPNSPSPTFSPTARPTAAPSASPTTDPTAAPSRSPSPSPTARPTAAPSGSPSASPSHAPTAKPTWSEIAKASQSASPIVGIVVGAICGAAVLWTVVSKAAGSVLARGEEAKATQIEEEAARKGVVAFFALANVAATAARARARSVQLRILHTTHLPAVALLIAAVQTVGMLGDITVVANAAPALEILTNALGWASLSMPLPTPLHAYWLGGGNNGTGASNVWLLDKDSLSRAVASTTTAESFLGVLFYTGAVLVGMLLVHIPIIIIIRHRIRDDLADEDKVMRYQSRRRDRRRGGGHTTKRKPTATPHPLAARPSSERPPDLRDHMLSSFPRYENWLILLVFQGLAQSSTAVLANHDQSASHGLQMLAGVVLALLVGFIAAVFLFLFINARGERAQYVELDDTGTLVDPNKKKKKKKEKPKAKAKDPDDDGIEEEEEELSETTFMWIDALNPPAGALDAASCYRQRKDVFGRRWDGFVTRWAVLFASFRPGGAWCGRTPIGLVVLLVHRFLVGVCVSAFGGDSTQAQATQVASLLVLYLLFSGYLYYNQPFMHRQTNVTEATVSMMVCVFCLVCVVLIGVADDTGGTSAPEDEITGVLVAIVVLAVALRLYKMLHASASRFDHVKHTMEAVKSGFDLHEADERERQAISMRKSVDEDDPTIEAELDAIVEQAEAVKKVQDVKKRGARRASAPSRRASGAAAAKRRLPATRSLGAELMRPLVPGPRGSLASIGLSPQARQAALKNRRNTTAGGGGRSRRPRRGTTASTTADSVPLVQGPGIQRRQLELQAGTTLNEDAVKGLQRKGAFGRQNVGTGKTFHKSPTRRSFDESFDEVFHNAVSPKRPKGLTLYRDKQAQATRRSFDESFPAYRAAADPRPRGLTTYTDDKDKGRRLGKGLQRAMAFGRGNVGTGRAFHKSPTRSSFDLAFNEYRTAAVSAPQRPRGLTAVRTREQGRRRKSQFVRLRERRPAVSHDAPLDIPKPMHHGRTKLKGGLRRLSSQQRMRLAVQKRKDELREQGEIVEGEPAPRRRRKKHGTRPTHMRNTRADPEATKRRREKRAKLKAKREKEKQDELKRETYIAARRRRQAKHRLSGQLELLPVLEEEEEPPEEAAAAPPPRRRKKHHGRHSYAGAARVALRMKTNHTAIETRPNWGGGARKQFIKL